MQPLRTTRLIALLAYAAVAVASAQQRNSEGYAKTLEGPERVARMQVPRVVEALALKPGDRMADVGSGSGLLTRPIARAVGATGVAYAVDIDAGLLKIVEHRESRCSSIMRAVTRSFRTFSDSSASAASCNSESRNC